MSFLAQENIETTYDMPVLNSFVKTVFSVLYSTVLHSTLILSTEMDSLAPKTPNLTPHMLKSDLWKFF